MLLNFGIPRRIGVVVKHKSPQSTESSVILEKGPEKDKITGKFIGNTKVTLNKGALVHLGFLENTYVQVRRVFKAMESDPTIAIYIDPQRKDADCNNSTLYFVNVTELVASGNKIPHAIKLTDIGTFSTKKIYEYLLKYFGKTDEKDTILKAEEVTLEGLKAIKLTVLEETDSVNDELDTDDALTPTEMPTEQVDEEPIVDEGLDYVDDSVDSPIIF